jgi:hypothetical protein
MKQTFFPLGLAAAATLLAGSAAAHHSDSLYFIDDRSADGGAIRIEGTISRVRWINPHSEFFVEVPSASGGEPAVWAIETDSVNQLRGLGWDDDTLQVGDKVVVVVSKSKFDDTAGRLRDMLVYGATPAEPVPFDAERQPGKETLLCARLNTDELATVKREFGSRVLLLRDAP